MIVHISSDAESDIAEGYRFYEERGGRVASQYELPFEPTWSVPVGRDTLWRC